MYTYQVPSHISFSVELGVAPVMSVFVGDDQVPLLVVTEVQPVPVLPFVRIASESYRVCVIKYLLTRIPAVVSEATPLNVYLVPLIEFSPARLVLGVVTLAVGAVVSYTTVTVYSFSLPARSVMLRVYSYSPSAE